MSEHPILFSAPMVLAILDGSKTQTRRVIKPQPFGDYYRLCGPEWYEPAVEINGELSPGREIFGVYSDDGVWGRKSPYAPGDRLWVRETFCEYPAVRAIYRADYGKFTPISDGIGGPWRPSIHMPRWASRIDLEVTAVRVERVQEIGKDDAEAEGVGRISSVGMMQAFGWRDYGGGKGFFDPRKSFASLWDSINAKRGFGWAANPWVWVYEFRRVKP